MNNDNELNFLFDDEDLFNEDISEDVNKIKNSPNNCPDETKTSDTVNECISENELKQGQLDKKRGFEDMKNSQIIDLVSKGLTALNRFGKDKEDEDDLDKIWAELMAEKIGDDQGEQKNE